MGWKENKKKHNEFVTKVKDLLMNEASRYVFVKNGDYRKLAALQVEYLMTYKYGWHKDEDYIMKMVSRRKNKYHFRVMPYSIVENIDINIVIEE